jgi:autophagy-related protein 17
MIWEQETIKRLDEASARLNATLDGLRSTIVDPAFREDEEESKCLFDFVDEVGVNDLYDSIKQSMDRFDQSQKCFVDTCTSFDDILSNATEALEADQEDLSKSQGYDVDGVSPVPSFFYALETHATEVASHLQGLVKHYDLCVSALRSTEGGGEAISKASQDEGTPQASRLAEFGLGITRLDQDAAPEQSAEDRIAMLAVIIKDAREVDDVVDEIKDRLADMEEHLARIQAYIDMLRSTSDRLRYTHHMLKQLLDQIPEYVSSCAVFQQAWEDEKGILTQRMEEIESLTEFYVGFAGGYDDLIIEVQRRRKVRRDMEKIASHALSQIEKLYKRMFSFHCLFDFILTMTDEVERREEFKAELGEFLPIDIWPGLMNPPIRYEVSAVGEEANNLPDLKRDVIEKAMQRITKRS